MDLLQAIFLGIVQGLTEWLPVSSSGHLVLAQGLMGLTVPVVFDVILHMGTLLAVLLFFRRDILGILKSLLRMRRGDQNLRLAAFVIIGTIPTAIIGIAFLGFFESLFSSSAAVGFGLLITGILLLASRFGKGNRSLDGKRSALAGVFQGIAIAPGISRSGATISAGLLSGLKREEIFRYSFLLSIPAIMGASLVEGLSNPLAIGDLWAQALAGAAVAAAAGYLAIRAVQKTLLSGRFWLFGIYCLLLGALVIAFL